MAGGWGLGAGLGLNTIFLSALHTQIFVSHRAFTLQITCMQGVAGSFKPQICSKLERGILIKRYVQVV